MPRPSKTGVRGLYRDQDGRYRIDLRWRDPSTGRRERFKERLPKGVPAVAAKNRAKEVLAAALEGRFDPRRERPRMLHTSLDEYLEWAGTNRPKSAADKKSIIKGLKSHFSDRKLDELVAFHVEGYKSKRVKGGAAPGTVNRGIAVLKHFYRLSAEWGWVSKAHADTICAVKKLVEPPGRVRYLTPGELTELFAALPETIAPIVEAALLSGMRLSEVVELRKDAVDFGNRQITIMRTKNNKVKVLPVSLDLERVLAQAMSRSGTPFVFVGKRGRQYTRHGFGAMFRRAVKKAGIEDFRFHDTRHDFATRVRRSGVGLDVIARLLGHSGTDMASRYAHLGDQQMLQAVSGISTEGMPGVVRGEDGGWDELDDDELSAGTLARMKDR